MRQQVVVTFPVRNTQVFVAPFLHERALGVCEVKRCHVCPSLEFKFRQKYVEPALRDLPRMGTRNYRLAPICFGDEPTSICMRPSYPHNTHSVFPYHRAIFIRGLAPSNFTLYRKSLRLLERHALNANIQTKSLGQYPLSHSGRGAGGGNI